MAEETFTSFNVEDLDRTKKQDYLAKQDLSTLDPSTLTPLTHNVISRQATINIGPPSSLSPLFLTF